MAGGSKRKINPEAKGKIVHSIKPLIFGGSPTYIANKTLLSPEEHAPCAVFYNNLYQELKRNQK